MPRAVREHNVLGAIVVALVSFIWHAFSLYRESGGRDAILAARHVCEHCRRDARHHSGRVPGGARGMTPGPDREEPLDPRAPGTQNPGNGR